MLKRLPINHINTKIEEDFENVKMTSHDHNSEL